MASVNPHTRELVFKLVFYGPGLGGKTTTLQYIYAATKPEHRGKMVSLATPTDRTLYFDFLPIRVPRVRGMAVRLQLFTVPGQVYYAATRKLVLSGADGIVFVADSQAGRVDVNQESIEDLHANLAEHNRALQEVPHTFHWNKRDLSELVPIDELNRRFNKYDAPSLGTVATKGEGVFEGLERIARLVLKRYESDPKVRIEPYSEGAVPTQTARLSEDAIARALRDMETQGAAADGIRPPSARVGEAPTKISQVLPDKPDEEGEDAPPALIATMASSLREIANENARVDAARAEAASARPSSTGQRSSEPRQSAQASAGASAPPVSPRKSTGTKSSGSGGWVRFDMNDANPGAELPVVSPSPSPPEVVGTIPPEARRDVPIFSLAELWPEPDRESVRQAEAMIAARDAVNAILACDVLVTRVLASAAGLVGTLDAPRDPAVVSLLLGLDGTRYLHFRTLVRAARHRESVSMRDALESFAFAIEARRAREHIRALGQRSPV